LLETVREQAAVSARGTSATQDLDIIEEIAQEQIDASATQFETQAADLADDVKQMRREEAEPEEVLEEAPGPIQNGDAVFIPHLHQQGVVEKVAHGDKVEVRIGRMHIRVPLAQVRKIRKKAAPKRAEPEWQLHVAGGGGDTSAVVTRKAKAAL